MKKVILSLAVSFISLAGFSQYRQAGSELSIGVEGALPVSDLKNATNIGFGATAKYAYNFDESVAVTLQSGYIYFPGKDLGGGKVNLSQIPLKAGVRFSMGQFYAEPQLGVGFWHGSAKATNNGEDGDVSFSNNTSGFTYAGNIGVMVSPSFDIGVRYEGMSKDGGNFNFIGLRLAYTFPLGK